MILRRYNLEKIYPFQIVFWVEYCYNTDNY